jgi:cation-transporting ATPase 13A2
LTGKTWALIKQYYPELIPKLTTRGTIFARMSPDQKQQLVQELQALGYYVGKDLDIGKISLARQFKSKLYI